MFKVVREPFWSEVIVSGVLVSETLRQLLSSFLMRLYLSVLYHRAIADGGPEDYLHGSGLELFYFIGHFLR